MAEDDPAIADHRRITNVDGIKPDAFRFREHDDLATRAAQKGEKPFVLLDREPEIGSGGEVQRLPFGRDRLRALEGVAGVFDDQPRDRTELGLSGHFREIQT